MGMGIVIFICVLLLLGALAGGKSFGDTLRKGCSTYLIIISIIIIVIVGIVILCN